MCRGFSPAKQWDYVWKRNAFCARQRQGDTSRRFASPGISRKPGVIGSPPRIPQYLVRSRVFQKIGTGVGQINFYQAGAGYSVHLSQNLV